MNKLYFSLIILFFLIGCSNISMLQKTVNTTPENLNEIMKEMVIKENHEIESEDGLNFTTKWRRAYKEEDNHPDNTVEIRLVVSIAQEKTNSNLSMKLMKRSSLYSTDPSNVTYTDIGIIQNDKLYMRWNDKTNELVQEFKRK
jgi:hypothetical protein